MKLLAGWAFLMYMLCMTNLYANGAGFSTTIGGADGITEAMGIRSPLLFNHTDCQTVTSTNVPLAISNPGAQIVSSTLNFSTSGFITHVTVLGVDISHTRVGDLRITLTSPQGTILTLLNRPGNGTCTGDDLLMWFDDHPDNPSTENNCNVTVPTLGGVFMPVEALSALIGENAFGEWTLTVFDMAPGDDGSLNNWGLQVCTRPCDLVLDSLNLNHSSECENGLGAIAVFVSTDSPNTAIYTITGPVVQTNETGVFTDIPLGTYEVTVILEGINDCKVQAVVLLGTDFYATDLPVVLSSSIDTAISILHIPETGLITNIKVSNLLIEHTWVGDLKITLTSPAGTVVVLKDRPDGAGVGCPQDDILVTFDDDAVLTASDLAQACNTNTIAILGTFQPSEPLSAFIGEQMEGDWILTVYDLAELDYGEVYNWGLDICASPCDVVLAKITTVNENCTGASNGSITVLANTTSPPITYSISGPVTQSNDTGIFENLPVGDYEVSVSISPGDTTCTLTDSVSIILTPETSLPVGWHNYNVGNAQGSATHDICAAEGQFVLTSRGLSGLFDLQHSASRSLCGDGRIIARVTSIENAGWAGIEMRENTTSGSRKVVLRTQLGTLVRRMVRTAPGVPLQSQQLATQPGPIWLQIVRAGNSFKCFVSSDGDNWQQVGNTLTLSLAACVQTGIFVEGRNANIITTAVFDQVSVTGNIAPLLARPEVAILPAANPAPELQLYPNPTTGDVTINLSGYASQAVQLLLYDAQGKMLKRLEIDTALFPTQQLDFSGYENGIYFVRAVSKGLPDAVKRVVVQGRE
ncbi:MAG: proprotein convertase P-domain-containing protein [Saprospiraceae bacterium]